MAYDELYDDGVVRPIYRNYLKQDSLRTGAERARALKTARACVSGDADFLPLVRLMTEREYRHLSAGVRQRGRALRMFLIDHYLGQKTYERSGILTASQVAEISRRYKTSFEMPALHPENIQFWYGPDAVRDEDGNFRIIEDNVGFVGGIGDLEALATASKALGIAIPGKNHPHQFYRQMAEFYLREGRRHGKGKTILLSYPKLRRWNHEDERLETILGNLGVTAVTNFRELKVREDGLFHRGSRVGFVIMNVSCKDIDPATKTPYRIANFWQAVSKAQVGVSYSPGFEILGDKNFCPSVEGLVEFYLGEKCLLPSLSTLRLESAGSLQKVRKARESWVIKLCNGQSGESVWVGKFVSPQMWETLLKRVENRPADFIAQKFCEPSRFLDHTVDIRPLALITPKTEILSPIPWARAAKNQKSKTNISRGGLLAPIAVVRG
jgi:uncharacterized circularly permuted ATP-grasp superfamily protein